MGFLTQGGDEADRNMSYGFGYINDLAQRIENNAHNKGFWKDEDTIGESAQIVTKLALIHSEVSEALEAYREDGLLASQRDDGKPEGFGSELADVIIRTLDLAEHYGINIEQEIANKMQYNETREYMHGGKKF